jgi:broad specificity phosphatase PhoE
MLLLLSTILGVVASIIGVVAFFFPDLGRRLIGWVRRAPSYNWPAIPSHIAAAKHRVFILQTWLPAMRMELPNWSRALKKEGIDFRVLLADQKLVPFRLRSREPVSSLLIQNVSDICELVEGLGALALSKMKVRFYSTLPFGPIYIIDDTIYWGLYLSHMDSMSGPVFQEQARSRLGKEIIKSFQSMWEDASERTGLLSVSKPADRKRDHSREEVDFTRRAWVASRKLTRIEDHSASPLDNRGGYLCLLRHAETDLGKAGVITGALDVGINAAGRNCLRQLGDAFERERWSSVYSSPARRCTETLAELLKEDSRAVQTRDELRERSMGALEGFSKSEYHHSLPQYRGLDLLNSFHASSTDGESYCDVFRRVATFAEEVFEQVLNGDRILLCSHDAVIRLIIFLAENREIDEIVTLEVNNAEPFFYAPRQ